MRLIIIRGVKFERNLAVISAAMDACFISFMERCRRSGNATRGVEFVGRPSGSRALRTIIAKAMSDFCNQILKNVFDGTLAS